MLPPDPSSLGTESEEPMDGELRSEWNAGFQPASGCGRLDRSNPKAGTHSHCGRDDRRPAQAGSPCSSIPAPSARPLQIRKNALKLARTPYAREYLTSTMSHPLRFCKTSSLPPQGAGIPLIHPFFLPAPGRLELMAVHGTDEIKNERQVLHHPPPTVQAS